MGCWLGKYREEAGIVWVESRLRVGGVWGGNRERVGWKLFEYWARIGR